MDDVKHAAPEHAALMGTPADAEAALADWARKWREYRQPLMAPAKEHKRRELLEREAGSRLCNAALLWLWHQENPPSSAEQVDGESSRDEPKPNASEESAALAARVA